MRKILFAIILISCVANLTNGQNTFKQNDIYLEAGGNGLWASVNYERQLTKEPGIGARIGIGFYTDNSFYVTIPVGINYLFNIKNNKSFIDAGLGVTWARSDEHPLLGLNFVNFIPAIGFRRHTSKNVMWRISLAPIINKYGFVPWLGASIGKRF
jgi:hypothetical protein